MEESARKSTRVSNLEKMTPEQRARAEAFLGGMGQVAAEALKAALIEKEEEMQSKEKAEKSWPKSI